MASKIRLEIPLLLGLGGGDRKRELGFLICSIRLEKCHVDTFVLLGQALACEKSIYR